MGETPQYRLEREFDAPRALVWRAWTEPALLARWYGPNVETVIHRYDLAPGGLWLTEMRMASGSHYQRAEFVEVRPPEKLVWRHSTADADWALAAAPMMPNWPRVLWTELAFAEEGARTRMVLTWTPHEASAEECAAFAAAIAGMDKGWAAGMALLAEILAELQA